MGQGLRPHFHQPVPEKVEYDFDKRKGCEVKKVSYVCMIPGCNWKKHEVYEMYYPPPIKGNSNKALNKNKKKYGNRK